MIPIFIITKDRITCLKQCIESYKKLGDIEIILVDNGSTYPEMVEFLRSKEYKVISNPNPTGEFQDISEWVSSAIYQWYKENDSEYYIVTDPDIEIENPSPKLLEYYIKLLNAFPKVTVVAPMLRIDDIPESFRLKTDMVKSHNKQFWHKPYFEFDGIKCTPSAVDTTFGMYRKSFVFRRLNHGIRVHEPFMAKHLDWYIDLDNPSEEQEYYWSHASNVSTLKTHVIDGKPIGW